MSYLEIGQSIQVRHLMAQLLPEGTVEASMQQVEARRRLGDHSFDFGVVQEGGRVIGIVAGVGLAESSDPVKQAAGYRRLDLDILVPEVTPICDLISYLAAFPFHLVVRGKQVIGLVHASDLNKHAVYPYFYLLLSRLEQALLRLISRDLPDVEQWRPLLEAGSWERMEQRARAASRSGQELPPIYYAGFSDFIRIVRQSAPMRRGLGFATEEAWDEHVQGMRDLRNDVMHPLRDLIGEHRNVGQLAGLQQRISASAEQVEASIINACVVPGPEGQWVVR